jgi:hypothetical protein
LPAFYFSEPKKSEHFGGKRFKGKQRKRGLTVLQEKPSTFASDTTGALSLEIRKAVSDWLISKDSEIATFLV